MIRRLRRVGRAGNVPALLVASFLTWAARAEAEPGAGAPAAVVPASPSPAVTDDSPAAPEAPAAPLATTVPPPTAPAAVDNAQLARQLEENRRGLAAAQAKIDDLTARVDGAATAEPEGDKDAAFKIYGFMDVGVERLWMPDHLAISQVLPSANATSFVIGNLNTYFDAQPVPGWRGLLEVRFTNAPNGEVGNKFGGLAGTFQRTSTQQQDPHAATPNATMWGGYTVIERAHIDWTDNEIFKVRVGNFFTPFGIWNVDHGTPTLISLQLPQLIAYNQFPIRQTGVMVYGSKVTGDWELGYNATVTNGRQELSNFAFDDNRGFGGRLFANRDTGTSVFKFGLSGYTGRVHDKEIDLVQISPVRFDSKANWDYREIAGGADISVDLGRTRIRAEGAVRKVTYEQGKHEPAFGLSIPGGFKPSRIMTSGYVLVAHQLPFAGLEPFVILDTIFGPIDGAGDSILLPGVGLNVHFNQSVMWKTQVSRTNFMNLWSRSRANETTSPSNNDLTMAYSRLVLVY